MVLSFDQKQLQEHVPSLLLKESKKLYLSLRLNGLVEHSKHLVFLIDRTIMSCHKRNNNGEEDEQFCKIIWIGYWI